MKTRPLAIGLLCLALAGCVGGTPSAAPVAPAGTAAADTTVVRVAALKGPSGMGLAKVIDAKAPGIQTTVFGTADEVTPALVKGDLDAALLPANVGAMLNARTNGAIQVAAVTILGVLYVVEAGDTVHTTADLAGKTVLTTGKGTTPQYVADFVLGKAGIADKVDLQYRSEATEVATALVSGQGKLGILPEPYVTTVLAKNKNLRVALDLTTEWEKAASGSQLVTGALLVRKQFAAEHPDAFKAFLAAYADSAKFVNDSPADAAKLIAAQGIVPDAATAQAAIPRCHIVALTGADAKAAVSAYLKVLYDANPASIGGKLPDDTFYYGA